MFKQLFVCKVCFFMVYSVLLYSGTAGAYPGRYEKEISGEDWILWLDREADWKNDSIYMPPVDITEIPVNPPTCGWDMFDRVGEKIKVTVPGTVEEYRWGANGNPIGIAGDYRGVSWWSRSFTLDPALKSKRITLVFDSVNLRAEVFINRKLVGYDVIGNTPFDLDVTDAVLFGEQNQLDVRITDPGGNFTWEDNDLFRWGNNWVPAVHGFGGITGKLYLRATDTLYLDDVHVENKPKVKEVEVFATLKNNSDTSVVGNLSVVIHEWNNPSNTLWEKTLHESIPPEGKVISVYVKVPKAELWDIRDAHLYVASVKFESADGSYRDSINQRFGFRYFAVGEKNGDKRFYLNGRRIFLFCAMTRGFWPKNGIFPTSEMARSDVDATLMFGFNMMLFHRAIGQHYINELCDEVGLLTYEEPGGYRCTPEPDEMAKIWRREKLRRMVIRDRSYPSNVIYNLKNEASKPPDEDDINNIKMMHELDPGRIITYNSDKNRDIPYNKRIKPDPYKLHMLPFDDTLYYYGWWDHHHWFGYPGYVDKNYNNPRFYLRGVVDAPSRPVPADSLNRLDPGEIIFWGEEGQFGTMMRLEKIKNELARTGSTGFREQQILHWYSYYNRFLDESGFRSSFPTVDDLTLSMGRNLHYFHGRSLENVRLGNVSDGYNLNGWAAPETSEDIVGLYRYPTADPAILSHYAQPLYVAVKIRDKVLPSGAEPVADFFIINELGVKGKHILEVQFEGPEGRILFSKNYPVTVLGGEEFGHLLVEEVKLPPTQAPGYYTLRAVLKKKTISIATGQDDIFVVDYRTRKGIKGNGAVIDTTGTINAFLKDARGITFPEFDPAGPDLDFIIIGPHNFRKVSSPYKSRYINAVMDRVANGTTLILLDQPDRWAEQIMNNLYTHASIEYIRSVRWNTDGRFIVGKNCVLKGLPMQQAMNWEYQVFYSRRIWGIDMTRLGTELIVALACENRKDIVSALSRVPFGNGQIFLSTLNIFPELLSNKPQSVVAKKLFLNMLEQ
ncbi:glycoside hydrolase family 2 protein [Candidatus Latescibacterota bacterium]